MSDATLIAQMRTETGSGVAAPAAPRRPRPGRRLRARRGHRVGERPGPRARPHPAQRERRQHAHHAEGRRAATSSRSPARSTATRCGARCCTSTSCGSAPTRRSRPRSSIQFVGEAEGVREGGLLEQSIFSITVEALPGDIPNTIEHDISALAIGDSIHVSDLAVPSGVVDPHRARRPSSPTSRSRASPRKRRRAGRGRGRRGRGRRGGHRRGVRRGRELGVAQPRCCGAPSEPARRPTCSSSGSAIPARSTSGTRHNVGAEVVELLARRHGARLQQGQGARARRRGARRPASGSRSRCRSRT